MAAFVGNAVVAASKLVAAAATGSSAMIAEGLHSVVDAANNLLMLLGIDRSRRAPDSRHPFGHGKELYFWALIIAVVIFGIGGGASVYEGVQHVLHPTPIIHPLWNYAVLLVAFVADGWTLVIASREFNAHRGGRGPFEAIRESKDPTKFTVVLEDGAATIGLLIAAVGVWLTDRTGNSVYDGAASIAIGLLLCAIAALLARESKGLLLGESARKEVVEGIRRMVEEDPAVVRTGDVLTMHLGPSDLLLNLDVQFAKTLDSRCVAAAIERLADAIRHRHPEVRRIFIEAIKGPP